MTDPSAERRALVKAVGMDANGEPFLEWGEVA